MDRFDLKYNIDGLIVKGNDLFFDVSDTQHVEDTINAAPGWWKEHFYDGVNVRLFLNSTGQDQVLARKIKIQLESDLYKCINPKVNFEPNGKLTILPNATI
jgi:hypothetical protein